MSMEHINAQTSVPDWLMTYCRQLADVHYQRKLNNMYNHMLESFLAYEPWKANPPYKWRAAKNHIPNRRVGGNSDSGWFPMNMILPSKLVERIWAVMEEINKNPPQELKRALSLRTFLYTAVCWWTTYVFTYDGPGMIRSSE